MRVVEREQNIQDKPIWLLRSQEAYHSFNLAVSEADKLLGSDFRKGIIDTEYEQAVMDAYRAFHSQAKGVMPEIISIEKPSKDDRIKQVVYNGRPQIYVPVSRYYLPQTNEIYVIQRNVKSSSAPVSSEFYPENIDFPGIQAIKQITETTPEAGIVFYQAGDPDSPYGALTAVNINKILSASMDALQSTPFQDDLELTFQEIERLSAEKEERRKKEGARIAQYMQKRLLGLTDTIADKRNGKREGFLPNYIIISTTGEQPSTQKSLVFLPQWRELVIAPMKDNTSGILNRTTSCVPDLKQKISAPPERWLETKYAADKLLEILPKSEQDIVKGKN